VSLGVFWAGVMVFNALFLGPAIRDAGPDGAKVMAGLMRRRMLDVVPAAAVLTIVSGLWLYWRVSGGLAPAWIHSPVGMAYNLGGLAAIVGFAIGITVLRPSVLRAAALGQAAAQAAPAERDMQLAQVQALRQRAAAAGSWVAALLTVAVLTMAAGRYL
jgi:hypothetical protein